MLSRGNTNVSDSLAPLSLKLDLSFSLPTGIGGGQFTLWNASLTGESPGGGAPLNVNFDNAGHSFSFSSGTGSGSFELAILNDPTVSKSASTSILGAIRNASFTSTSADTSAATVPEPVTLALFGLAAGRMEPQAVTAPIASAIDGWLQDPTSFSRSEITGVNKARGRNAELIKSLQ